MSSTETPRRLDAYVRVSQTRGRKGESFIAPQIQDERIRAWATSRGHTITNDGPDNGAWHELDVSGGKMDRPKLNEVLARIDAGDSDGIVVYRLDRFGRTLIGSLQIIERLHKEGKLFASVSDGFDISTETGRLVMRVLLSLAQFELERIERQWKDARNKAVARGVHISPPLFGYERRCTMRLDDGGPECGGLVVTRGPGLRPACVTCGTERGLWRLAPDPITGPYVTEVFRRRVAGATWAEIRDWLNGPDGAPTVSGSLWTSTTVREIVPKRVYVGEAEGGYEGSKKQAHKPLIDEATWEAAQGPSIGRREEKHSPVLTTGLVRCAGCRYGMNARKRSGTGRDGYAFRCTRLAQVGDCVAPSNISAIGDNGNVGLDDIVVAAMFARAEEIEYRGVDAGDDLDTLRIEAEAAAADHARASGDINYEREHGARAHNARVHAYGADAKAKQERLEQALARAGRSKNDQPVAVLRRAWESGEMTDDDKRAHLRRVVRAVFVRPADGNVPGDPELRRDYLARRIHIVWAGASDAVVDVPRPGRRAFDAETNPTGYRMRPFGTLADGRIVWPNAQPDDAGVTALEIAAEDER